jgi:DNA-binding NarL/FixJ family response regulator
MRPRGRAFITGMLDFTETDGLFDNFEVNREPFWPRISWLIAGSGAWHLVLLACIILIPPVRNALNIAVMFSGGGFVDRPYDKTEIGNDGDITEITLEKFHYPEGYFAIDQQGMPIQQSPPTAPFTPPVFSPSQVTTPSPTPAPSPGASPSPAIAANSPAASPPVKTAAENKDAEQKAAAKAQKDLEDASKKTGIELAQEGEVNKRPFKDLAAYATGLRDTGKLDFEKPFEVAIDTELGKDGKLVNQKVSKKVGDAVLVDLGEKLVSAMNDSGVLFYLKKINEDKPGTKVVFLIKQDGNEVVATVTSEVSSADSARQLAAAFRLVLATGAETRKGKDEEILLRSTTVSADGKNVVFKLTMAHKDVVDIVKKGIVPEPSPTASPS